jgi:hypothetical protein
MRVAIFPWHTNPLHQDVPFFFVPVVTNIVVSALPKTGE